MTGKINNLIRDHRLAQIRNGAAAYGLVYELANRLKTGKISKAEFITAVVGSLLLTHQAATRLATQFLQQTRQENNLDGEIITPDFDTSYWVQATEQTLTRFEQTNYDARFDKITAGLCARADWQAKTAGRNTVAFSAEASGRGWRRVSDGNPCAFCAMLVARGPVYHTKETAGLGNKYHAHCGCAVVEHVGVWTPTATEQQFVELYRKSAGGSTGEVLARMRANGKNIVNDAHIPDSEKKKPGRKPKTATGSSGGRKPPERKPLSASGGEPRRHEVQYSGVLGGKGNPKPPSVDVLIPYLAPEDDKWSEFSDDERHFAMWLEETLGYRLWSLKRRLGDSERTPEALFSDLSSSIELKTAKSHGALVSQARQGRKQSSRIAIWSGLDAHVDVQRAIGSVLSQYGADIKELVVAFNNGEDYVQWIHAEHTLHNRRS